MTINNCLHNNVVSHVQSKASTHEAWLYLNRLCESHYVVVTKIFLKDKMQKLKMKEDDNVTKSIHVFRFLLEQLVAIRMPI
jgi:translation initiation factor IF-1